MVNVDSWKALYPFRSHFLTIGRNRYHYLDEGDRQAPPIVLLHGNPTWSFYYRTIIPALSKHYRVVVPDHMGCGLSDKPQRYDYILDSHICNLEELVRHLDLRGLTLGMHDWGGPIGMGYAVRHPGNMSRFIVFNSGVFPSQARAVPLVVRLCGLPVMGSLLVQGLNAFARAALRLAVCHLDRISAPVRAGFLAPYGSWNSRRAILQFIRDIPDTPRHRSYEVLSRIDSCLEQFRNNPMLLVWGQQDFVFSVEAFLEPWRLRFPDAEVQLLQDAGHYVIEDAYERIVPRMLEFLGRG